MRNGGPPNRNFRRKCMTLILCIVIAPVYLIANCFNHPSARRREARMTACRWRFFSILQSRFFYSVLICKTDKWIIHLQKFRSLLKLLAKFHFTSGKTWIDRWIGDFRDYFATLPTRLHFSALFKVHLFNALFHLSSRLIEKLYIAKPYFWFEFRNALLELPGCAI